jgi:hypothetical protein
VSRRRLEKLAEIITSVDSDGASFEQRDIMRGSLVVDPGVLGKD